MTLFSPEPKSFYRSHGFGVGNTECSFEMWQLLSLSNRSMFAFENGLLSDRLPAKFDQSLYAAAEQTINQPLGDKRVSNFMKLESPWDFYEALKVEDHSHLKLDIWHQEGLQGLAHARCLAWSATNRKLTKDEKGFVLLHSEDYQP